MSAPIVVGVDPGERWIGIAILRRAARPRWIGGDVLDLRDLQPRLDDPGHGVAARIVREVAAAQGAARVLVEVVREFHGSGGPAAMKDKARRTALTSLLAGRILGDVGRDRAVREVEASAVRARWIVMPGPREAKARREAGERLDLDGALLEVALREIDGFPVREIVRGGRTTHEAEIQSFGGAYQLPKRGETVGRLRAECIPHLVDAALAALEAP
jgi:hypothetical protein